MISDVIYKTINDEIEDIFVCGFLENKEGLFVFHPLYDNIYIVCSGVIYKIFLCGNNLDAIIIPEITPCFEIDEDDFFAKSSIYIQLFNTEFPVKVLDISINKDPLSPLYVKVESYGNELIIKIDPKNTFGLSIAHVDNQELASEYDYSRFR